MKALGTFCRYLCAAQQSWAHTLREARQYTPRHSLQLKAVGFMSTWHLP